MLLWFLLHTLAGITIGALEADRFQFMATLVFSGPLIGVAQWAVLRRILRRSGFWVAASAIGWWLGILLMIRVGNWLDPWTTRLGGAGVGGIFWMNVTNQFIVLTAMGAAQSLMLRAVHRRGAKLFVFWIGLSAIGGAAQGGSSAIVCARFCPALTEQVGGIVTTAIVYGVGWFCYSVITAIVLRKLLFFNDSERS